MELSIKKLLMKQLWRVQQTQAFVSIIFWSLALTGIFYERANYYLYKYFGMDEDEDKQVITKMAMLFTLVVVGVLSFGFLYDAIFRMWEQQTTVTQERSPYSIYKFNAFQALFVRNFQLPLMRAANTDGKIDKDIEFMQCWINKVLESDEILKHHVEHVEKWVVSDEAKWTHIDERQIMKIRNQGEDNGD